MRNRDDGTVEAELQGEPERLDAVLAWMAEGPPGSVVESRDVADLEPVESSGFDVR